MIVNTKSLKSELQIDSATPRRRIYLMRVIAGASQSELAGAAGVSTRTLQRMEYGESPLTIDLVFAAANLFQVEPGLFFSSKFPPITTENFYHGSNEKLPLPNHLYPELFSKIRSAHKGLQSPDQYVPIIRYNLKSLDLNSAAQSLFGLKRSSYPWLDFISKEALVVIFDTLTQVEGNIYLSHSHFPIENTLIDSINVSLVHRKHSDAIYVVSSPVDASPYCGKYIVDMTKVHKDFAAFLGHAITLLPNIS